MSIWKRLGRWFVGPQIVHVTTEPSEQGPWYYVIIEWDNGRIVVARGNVTVFHDYLSGTRLSTELERVCSDAVTAHQWMKQEAP